ncbi:hypothetical protein EOM89_08430, partial [Candidatus Falkowbacteria bacterium]|nr:hypothetical protein [Candidatus Falkowbacteria bacterium]
EMLRWFFPAWVLLVVVRSGLLGHRAGQLIVRGLVFNAGLLALFGLVQFADGTKSIFWIQPIEDHFFASFGYANHAGAFFVLMLSVALGQKLAAQATPVLGAIAGAAINYSFTSYYQDIARVHFGLKRLALSHDLDEGFLREDLRARISTRR